MVKPKYEEKPRDIHGIPTAHGLTIMGPQYATYTATGHIHITEQGNRLLGQELRDAALESLEEGTWHGVSGAHPRSPDQPGYLDVERHSGGQRGHDKR
jgi:hypothetical protein